MQTDGRRSSTKEKDAFIVSAFKSGTFYKHTSAILATHEATQEDVGYWLRTTYETTYIHIGEPITHTT